MTHEEIEAAIGRLRSMRIANRDFIVDVCRAFLGGEVTGDELHYTLIELLEQADPDTHMNLPVDVDGVPIHLGDELCGYGHPDGGVYCQAIVNESIILVGETSIAYKDWLLWDTADCRHRHKSTVEELLFEFGKICQDGYDIGNSIHEYAEKIREAMADE